MSTIYLYDDNFINPDVVSSTDYSSQQTAFPYSNITNFNRRSKVWRSNGYWNITSSNNTIIFEETSTVNLTATVAAGEYSSTTAMLAALKTALEDAGASTYTCSVDASTNKIEITSNGSGGGGIFNIEWSHASTTMADTLGFDDTTDDTGALTYTADELHISTGEFFTWDMGLSSLPQAIAIIGPRNTPLRISPSATLKLQGNETDVWTAPTYEQTLTYDDSCIALFDADGLHTEALRFWRLLIEDLDNPLGYIEIGSIFLGRVYSPTYGRPQFPFDIELIDRSPLIFSEGGQTFSDIREQTAEYSTQWLGLRKDEVERIMTFFADVGTARPFFVLLDPDEAFSTDFKKSLKYVKFASQPRFSLTTPNNYRMSLEFREEL
jgi:hypothetical protein